MTSDAEYFGWVRLHCLATAANAEASASLVSEVALYQHAYAHRLPLILKGPTAFASAAPSVPA